ncbi:MULTISPECIES: zinc metalloprotease [Thermomonosporaceae]|uniref:zinc metalloprotease n=1 Tax=Thermomonosporaceae TaxID=2012 RepID=UPI00255AC0E8|nr:MULTISPECIES: zinc metalloprotease [Thermomonosporaceae]MDL4775678.1 zinc metalloprotease [Actinomadura xylanilytica]
MSVAAGSARGPEPAGLSKAAAQGGTTALRDGAGTRAAEAGPCTGGEAGDARLRQASGPGARDRHDLGREQVNGMLADLRQTLGGLYGTEDETAVDDASRMRAARISVPVRFHVVADGRTGRLSRSSAQKQVATLNAAYGGRKGGVNTGVSFRLAAYDVTSNARWFRQPQRSEREMKTALHRGGAGTLNLYSAQFSADGLGYSTFPQWYRKKRALDGVVIDHRSVPGGSYAHFDRGYTAVHEIGHWLGLFHTFENGCDAPGDGVADTPYEAVPAEGCPKSKDTCPQPGRDPVRNFMNYGWDACMHEFTAGQGRRIRAAWAAYRGSRHRSGSGAGGNAAARSVGGAR